MITPPSGPRRGSRFDSPLWRVLGSAVSWFGFTFCFTLLYLGSAVVMGLGGFCASGGPYVIETQCPQAVIATTPLSIFGGLAAVALGFILTRGFGTPLVSWAWPVLFVGLGAAFLIASAQPGGITFLIIGVLFVAMGLVPLAIVVRASVRNLFLGTHNVAGVKFESSGRERASYLRFGRWQKSESDETAIPTAGDWALALGITIVAIGLGIYLADQLFMALGG